MEEKKIERRKIAKEALKAINELEETTKLESVVKDNKVEFKEGEDIFRVRKPTFLETQEIGVIKRKKYINLVDDGSYLFKKQWVEKYKSKGIDVDKMEDDINRMQDDIKKLLLRLAEAKDKKEVSKLKEEILKVRDKQCNLSMEKTDLLSYSIEDQLLIHVNSYTTYLVLEKKVGDKWERYFKSYKEFSESEKWNLVNKAFYYINLLIYGV